MRTLEQRRAANALSRVQALSNNCDVFKKRYRAYVDRLGPTIVINGLGQALAIERAAAGSSPQKEDERAHNDLYASMRQWLCREDGGVYPSESDLLTAITKQDETHYLLAQAEALAWLAWHKKFCRAFFPRNEEE